MVRCIDDVRQAFRDRSALAYARFLSMISRPRFPLVSLASSDPPLPPLPGRGRGRPRLWYGPGDLVSVGGVDGVYVRRINGTKGRCHRILTELPPSSLEGDRSSACLNVYGPVYLLLSLQTMLDLGHITGRPSAAPRKRLRVDASRFPPPPSGDPPLQLTLF